jgi:hypothetical protein
MHWKICQKCQKGQEMNCCTLYYATTEIQSKTTVGSIICAVLMPTDITVFRQQALALELAKAKHPNTGIIGMVAQQSQSLPTQQALAASSKPFYVWEEEGLDVE